MGVCAEMAILRKWGHGCNANSGAFYTILPNIWHPWRSWVRRLHMEVQLELWEKFESNLLVLALTILCGSTHVHKYVLMQTYHPVFSVSKRANICKRLMKLYFATLPNPGLLGFCRGTRMYLVRKLFPRPWRHVQELKMQQFPTRILHIGIRLHLAAKKMNIQILFRKNYVKLL